MIYLKSFSFPDIWQEEAFLHDEKRTCFDSFYPFQVLSRNELQKLEFEDITILYGGNGSGKTTALNVMAEKIGTVRESIYNRTNFFGEYVRMCDFVTAAPLPGERRIITSDDVFDYMLDLRALNQNLHNKREELFLEYTENKYSDFRMRSLDDYEQLKKVNMSKRKSQSQYIRGQMMDNVRTRSNGESAFLYFTEKITENGLYFLDEPENSLSPQRQRELSRFIQDSARFFGCQFVISTHSPFMLAMEQAKVYDLDEMPVRVKKWTELANVREYYDFFKEHEGEF